MKRVLFYSFCASMLISPMHAHESDSLYVNLIPYKNSTSMPVPAKMNFSGENVPLHLLDVRERLDREIIINRNLHSSTELILKRANRAFPIIEPILKEYGVPDDFKYLAVIESGLTNATSSAGAKGVWQFMPATAKEFGMEVSDTVDERYDIELSTRNACKYLLKAKEKFGSWTLAAAAYNRGSGGVGRSLEQQYVTDYYDLLLTEETSRYVFRILALKDIMERPEQYGFVIPESEKYPIIKTKKVEVNANIDDLAKFAKDNGTNYKTLKILNPWLRDTKLVVKPGKTYYIELLEE
ncbi:lytic transglycosylase domain-containing protein [Flavobacterium agricola]|uniref:Lytic transglycosylase domain-containing protein n=1 Tax=Flavobacterium agricola TaxID=2870839 RepID=A0ABY6LZ28_9FLAO|nr:lytic transglycosylase domain-containing protein [Flavobacterium agricola]UYW01579.1 lytic transglycosylase domain-containing protein [Flavobacterium agricola]